MRRKLKEHHETHHRRRRATATTGTIKHLVVPFRFSDHATRSLPSVGDWEILMNGDDQACSDNPDICGLSGSVQKYFDINSHGQLTIESVVADYITIATDEATAANQEGG